jgi:hypothetical protein
MYEDNTVRADDSGITISRYKGTGTKLIPYDQIRSATVFDMDAAGRWTVIGVGPTRIRSWYNWDSSRRSKTKAIEIDSGGKFHPTVTPDDSEAFIAAISDHVKIT